MWSFKKNIYKDTRVAACLTCVNHDVVIDTQIWMGCNLNVSTYRDGTPIPQISDPTAWVALTTGAWCHYDNDPANDAIYGKLYNWYAVNDIRGLAPVGYLVPLDTEWTILSDYLATNSLTGDALKEIGTCHWTPPNATATNITGFTALPGGVRYTNGIFDNLSYFGFWWSSVEDDSNFAFGRFLNFYNNSFNWNSTDKKNGFSVRLIKDPGHIE